MKHAIQCAMNIVTTVSLANFMTTFTESDAMFSSNLTNNLESLKTLSNLRILKNLIILSSLRSWGAWYAAEDSSADVESTSSGAGKTQPYGKLARISNISQLFR